MQDALMVGVRNGGSKTAGQFKLNLTGRKDKGYEYKNGIVSNLRGGEGGSSKSDRMPTGAQTTQNSTVKVPWNHQATKRGKGGTAWPKDIQYMGGAQKTETHGDGKTENGPLKTQRNCDQKVSPHTENGGKRPTPRRRGEQGEGPIWLGAMGKHRRGKEGNGHRRTKGGKKQGMSNRQVPVKSVFHSKKHRLQKGKRVGDKKTKEGGAD